MMLLTFAQLVEMHPGMAVTSDPPDTDHPNVDSTNGVIQHQTMFDLNLASQCPF